MKYLYRFMFVVVLMACLIPCPKSQAKVSIKSVALKSNYGSWIHVAVGKKVKATVTVKASPDRTEYKGVTWTSTNSKIATVSGGYVKGIKKGKCRIVATSKRDGKKKAKMTVKVVDKVKSLSVEAAKKNIYIGNSLKLKAVVAPASGSFKKVIWKSSNTSIATVNSEGVVTGRKAGDVTISATTVEGSNISKSVKLTILSTNSVYITNMEPLNCNTVRVSLNKACKLTANQCKVEGKNLSNGTYVRTFKATQLHSYSNQIYDITLADDYSIERNSFVRVTLSSLPGNGKKKYEARAAFLRPWKHRKQTWIGLVGEQFEQTVDFSEYCYGNIKYEVTGSIPDVTMKRKDNQLIFSGKLATSVTDCGLTIKATDEMGTRYTQEVRVSIGNPLAIASRAEHGVFLVGTEVEDFDFVTAVGGSGKYSFSAMNLPTGLHLDAETGKLQGKAMSVGEYQVQITAVDQEDENRTCPCTATIQVKDQKPLVGQVQDMYGTAVSGASVVCQNIVDACVYETQTDSSGNYTLAVSEGSYDISVTKEDVWDRVYKLTIGSGGRQFNVTLPGDFRYLEVPNPDADGGDEDPDNCS